MKQRRQVVGRALGALACFVGFLSGADRPSNSWERVILVRTNALEEPTEEQICFQTRPGLIYRIEQCLDADKDIWGIAERFVADDDEGNFIYQKEGRRHRVFQEDDRIQFPDWHDRVEQYLYFDVWTAVKGTYHLKLYGDGKLLYSATKPIPPNGRFGVHDASYDPADWPNAGYYDVSEWRLWVNVTPNVDARGEIITSVKKIGGRNSRVALTRKAMIEERLFKRASDEESHGFARVERGSAGPAKVPSTVAQLPDTGVSAAIPRTNTVEVPSEVLAEVNRLIAAANPFGIDGPLTRKDFTGRVDYPKSSVVFGTKTHTIDISRNRLRQFIADRETSNPIAEPEGKRDAMREWYKATAKWSKGEALAEAQRIIERLGIQTKWDTQEVEATELTLKTPQGEAVQVTPFYIVKLGTSNATLRAEFRMGESGPGRLTDWYMWPPMPNQ